MNITVDDTNGDPYTNLLPSYAPFNAWTTVSGSCTAPCPDVGHVSGGTWHATTQTQDTSDSAPHTVILTFNGAFAPCWRGTSLTRVSSRYRGVRVRRPGQQCRQLHHAN
jgi:hypothetical protein